MFELSRLLRAVQPTCSSGLFVQSAFLGVVALGCFLTLPGEARAQSTGTASKDQKTLADELPRIPPVPADKTGPTFALQHGFRLELFAAEPQVASPVDACFDENGRMYVAEMRDYPFSWEPTKLNPAGGGKKDAGVVRLLEDTDGDGKADRSVIFADKLTWPTSVCCYRGGVFVLAPPHLHYFKDTDGDGRADVHQIVLSGFGRDNVQAIANNLKWSLDNRIVFAAGRNGGTLTRDGKKVLRHPRTGPVARSGNSFRLRRHRRRTVRPLFRRLGEPLRLQQQQSHRAGRAGGAIPAAQSLLRRLKRDPHDCQGGTGRARLSQESARAVAGRPHAAARL